MMGVCGHVAVPRWWMAASAIGLAGLFGCGSKAEITIIQSALPHPQDKVVLESEWAYFAADQPGVERALVIFPLPGARAGDRRFFLYMRVPSGRSGPARIGDAKSDRVQAAGFFIQSTGRLAGKTTFTEGWIDLRRPPLSSRRHRQGKIAVNCSDGSFIRGEFHASLSPFEVVNFEDAKAADVRALTGSRGEPVDNEPDLGPRDGGGRP